MSPSAGIYGWSTGKGGVHFYRIEEPLRVAAAQGVNAAWGLHLDDAVAEQHDTILAHMLNDERHSEAWEKLAANGAHRLIFDIDDAMWAPDWGPFREHYTPEVMARVWRNISLAHVVTTPSPLIAEYVQRHNPNVFVCYNSVPEWLTHVTMPDRARPRIGYQGSSSHRHDFSPGVLGALHRFLFEHPLWDMHVWGEFDFHGDEWLTGRIGKTGWQGSMAAYYRSLSMDIGLGPLARTTFNDCKSGLRAIEYAALGIPAVLADSPAYRPWIVNCVSGFLPTTDDEWYSCLHQLATDDAYRQFVSHNARNLARKWTTEAQFPNWAAAWNSV
jgi:hypothetical protein